MLIMYDVGDKLLSGIKSMYVDSSVYVRAEVGESEWFRIDSGVIQRCIISPRLLNVYMKEVKIEMGRRGVSFMEDGRE